MSCNFPVENVSRTFIGFLQKEDSFPLRINITTSYSFVAWNSNRTMNCKWDLQYTLYFFGTSDKWKLCWWYDIFITYSWQLWLVALYKIALNKRHSNLKLTYTTITKFVLCTFPNLCTTKIWLGRLYNTWNSVPLQKHYCWIQIKLDLTVLSRIWIISSQFKVENKAPSKCDQE